MSLNSFKTVNHCRTCGNDSLIPFLDLKDQPLANQYHNNEKDLDNFPLKVHLCNQCYHTQLSGVIEPSIMFSHYLYVSGTTETLNQYFKDFADTVIQKTGKKKGRVLDIGCNDGSQLKVFKELGWTTVGVDPAQNLTSLSKNNSEKIICSFWNTKLAEEMAHKSFDVIIAQNVFAHTDDLMDFLIACKKVMTSESHLFIQTSQSRMYERNEFDTIYHEHVSFFSALSMQAIAKRCGFFVKDAYETDIHGTSYVFILTLVPELQLKLEEMIWNERQRGRYELSTYFQFKTNAQRVIADLIKVVLHSPYKVIGYGAAAKGNTLLNFAQLKLSYIVDDNPLKWGLWTPGQNILIQNPKVLEEQENEPLMIIPLAWNFFTEIQKRVKKLRTGHTKDIYVRYFPELELTSDSPVREFDFYPSHQAPHL